MAGLGALMAKGVKNVGEAREILGRAVKTTEGIPDRTPTRPVEPTAERVEPPPPSEVAPVGPAARPELAAPSPEEVSRVQVEDQAVQDLLAQRAETQAATDERNLAALEQAGATPEQAVRVLDQTPPPEAPRVEVPPTPEALPTPEPPRVEAVPPVETAPVEAARVVEAPAQPVVEAVPARVQLAEKAVESQVQDAVKGLRPEHAAKVLEKFEPERAAWVDRIAAGENPRVLRDRFRSQHGLRNEALKEVEAPKIPVAKEAPVSDVATVLKEAEQVPAQQVPAGGKYRGKPSLEVGEQQGEVRPELLKAGEKLGAAKRRVWEVIPAEEQPGVMERFLAAKKGGEIRSPGGDKGWPIEKNLPRMQRFVELLGEKGTRDEAIKALAKERKTAPRAEGNFVNAFESSLGEFYAGEKGVAAPARAGGITADEVSALKTRKAELDARFPAAKDATPEQMQGVLQDYQQFIAARKDARVRGLGTKDQALWDRRLNEFATELKQAGKPINVPAGTNADVVVKKIARALGVKLEQAPAPAETMAPGAVAVAAKPPVKVTPKYERATALWKPATDLPRGSRRNVKIGLGGSRAEWIGDEVHLEKIESPEGGAKDVRDLLADPAVKVVNVGDLRQTPKARAEFRKALDAALVDYKGNTRAAWRTEGETLIPIRQASGEIEKPRIEAAQARDTKPNSKLSLGEFRQRAAHYVEDAQNGTDLGDGMKVVDHDRMMTPEYVAKVAETSKLVAPVLKRLTDELSEVHEEGIEFGGLTTSPYLSGLHHDGKVYLNSVEAVHAAATREGAVDNMLFTLFHEAAHAQGAGHDPLHAGYARYVERLAKDEGRLGEYRKALMEALPEETYQRIKTELVPEFRRKWEEINGESWRAEGEQGVDRKSVV
jgi:hypothetical protein